MAAADLTLIFPGYRLVELLYKGSKTVVYRAVEEAAVAGSEPRSVAIKLLEQDYPSFNDLLRFRNQYTIAKNLDVPGIVRPYRLEFYRNSYALVMEDFGGISLREWMGKWGDSETIQTRPIEVLKIALQITDILHHLHQNRVIHKDIKPANILIHPETKQVKIIDFSISSLLPKETQEIKNPNGLEGTLAYLAPEQTGRMNRGIDYRSDFYALGVTLFELLSGQLPFESKDPMELVYCHIAKQPDSICDLNPKLPLMLGEIVRKLMAKNAEDRYQSAIGLKHDLATCLEQWQATGKNTWFELGQRDVCDRFLIPEKLYGREKEVQALLEAFGRVANGAAELMLVAGFSGIGKTAVVNEVHKPIVRWNGYFIKGKFDQFNRNIPFSAFVQAFRDLMAQLLCEVDDQLAQWKANILTALGENARVIIDVIPELEQIVGQQPPVPELSGNAAQNRFNLLFEKFIQVFTTVVHPLVMFLDDLQWADSASLNLIQVLMSQSKAGYLLLIGAYRDNEVSPAHPLILTLAELNKASATMNTVTLAPLSPASLNALVGDTLQCRETLAQPLTELIYQKTEGNPFFSTQFLKALHEEGWIEFDPQAGHWQCDIAQVRSLSLTDDVVEFMAIQLQKLPPKTQEVLKLAACIGNSFDLATLAIVSEQSQIETAAMLWKALQEGLILPQSEVYKFYQDSSLVIGNPPESIQPKITNYQLSTYKFLHDRVQQAAYSLIPEVARKTTHLKIGQLLLHNTPTEKLEENIFDIVNQLNIGIDLISQQSEKTYLAQLNLIAGRKAKAATAYESAIKYLRVGLGILAKDSWQTQYELTLCLYESAAEAEYLNISYETSKTLGDIILSQAKTLLDKVNTYELQIQSYNSQNKLLEALNTGLEVLKFLGISFPKNPNTLNIVVEMINTKLRLGMKRVEDLANLPEMTDVNKKAAMRILSGIVSTAIQTKPQMVPMLTFMMVKQCIQYGNSPYASIAYVYYGVILCRLGDIDSGYQFGELAIRLLDKFESRSLRSRVYAVFSCFIKHWKGDLNSALSYLTEGFKIGLETGDLEYAGYSIDEYCAYKLWIGTPLAIVEQETDKYVKLTQQLKLDMALQYISIVRQTALNLSGKTVEPGELVGDSFNEVKTLPILIEARSFLLVCLIYNAKIKLNFLFSHYDRALENARLFEKYEEAAAGLYVVSLSNLYYSLSLLALFSQAGNGEQKQYLKKVAKLQKKMKKWAAHAPMNLQHKYELVEAEKARVLGQKERAIDYYDRAISAAKENSYIQEEALANELAAKFYLDSGKQRIARDYLIEAYYGYARWGAKAKVADLETRYPQLLAPILQQTPSSLCVNETISAIESINSTTSSTSRSSSISNVLDLAAILKAYQILSGEIELEKLLSTLMRVVIENAGADKCVLMLPEEGELMIQAIANANLCSTLLSPHLVEASQDVPISLINTVKRSLQPAVIVNATVHPQFGNDPYIQQQQTKSILCSPILHQGKLLGVLYLENNLATGAFTLDRVELLNLLCTQAAISLQNARLYAREQEKSQSLQASLEQLKQSESRAQQLFEQSNDSLSLFSPRTGFIDCNQAMLDLFGYISKDEFLSLHPSEISPEFQPDGQASFARAEVIIADALQKASNQFEWVHQRANGENFWAEITQTTISYKGETIFHTVIRDISDRKQAEASLAKEREFLNAIIHNITDGIVACDANGNLTLFNKATREFHGLPVELLLPEQWAEYFDLYQSDGKTPLPITEIALFRALQGEIVENAEMVIAPKHGSKRILLASGQAIVDAWGNKLGAVVVMRDISDRKRIEAERQQKSEALEKTLRELQQAQIQLIQAEKMSALGNLVAGVAHEINNPVGFLTGNITPALEYINDLFGLIDLVQQKYPQLHPEIQEEIETIELDYIREDLPKLVESMREGVKRIQDISISLRTFSRADSDRPIACNIHDGINSTLTILKHRLKANHSRPEIKVIKDYGDLPKIECYAGQLNQVFMNILANAIDALDESNQGRIYADIANQITIKTQLSPDHKQVIIYIKDNGFGMSEAVREKIFDDLFTTKGVGKGTGLGLAIARQIVSEKHGGTIDVNSELGKGTEFIITLPILTHC